MNLSKSMEKSPNLKLTPNYMRSGILKEIAEERHLEILESLGLRLRKTGRYYSGKCPLHGGRKTTSFNIFLEGDTHKFYWRCNTRHCEEQWRKRKAVNIISLVQAVLSHDELGWSQEGDNTVS